jgi:hypothetical protein
VIELYAERMYALLAHHGSRRGRSVEAGDFRTRMALQALRGRWWAAARALRGDCERCVDGKLPMSVATTRRGERIYFGARCDACGGTGRAPE